VCIRSLALLLGTWATGALAATSWEIFLERPTPENAARVQAIEYTAPLDGGYKADDLHLHQIDDLRVLETQVRAADTQAFRLAYRLYIKSDGGLPKNSVSYLGK
jgi:hypothetical protein